MAFLLALTQSLLKYSSWVSPPEMEIATFSMITPSHEALKRTDRFGLEGALGGQLRVLPWAEHLGDDVEETPHLPWATTLRGHPRPEP